MNKGEEKISRDEALLLISKSSIYGNLGLFIGAGMSMAILNDEWTEVALSWKQLISKCADELQVNLFEDIKTDGLSYPEIASEIAKFISTKESIEYKIAVKKLKEKIATLTSWYPENDQRKIYGKILEDIEPSWIITTNYDLIIECLLTGKCLSLEPNDQLISPQNLIPIYHLHGIRTNPSSIIISQEDYISLFRPNQYRQQKLSLSIKESTTLIIGYSLGDVNVLTAVDWAQNVYKGQRVEYPHEIIQLLYTERPQSEPYRDRNNILIIEFNDLKTILSEIAQLVIREKINHKENEKEFHEINFIFQNPEEVHVTKFIDDYDFRKSIIDAISDNDIKLISGFLELFSRAIDETWERAKPRLAFWAYNENLIILLDIIENIQLSKLPPALLEAIAYNLDRVAFYIGEYLGQSVAAFETWKLRKENLPIETKIELENIARARNYTRIKQLFEK
jgi:hypothetical protein